jgi:DNA-directed RNA polymerase subunit RPC12/RpoP
MGPRMEPKEPVRIGTKDQNGNGQAMRFLEASEQFSTRSCARCAGLLVNEWCYDLKNTGDSMSRALRCVQCGHRIDAVILQNQIHRRSEARVSSKCITTLRGDSPVG